MKKRKLKIKKLAITLIIILIIIFLTIILFYNSNDKLKKIGYNQLEIKEIEKLSDKEIKIISNYKYNDNTIYIIKNDNYDSKKLDLYMKYTLEYKDINYLKILKLLNNKNIKNKNITNYLELLKDYDNISGIINYVNNYSNKNIKLNEATLCLIEEKYFILEYLDRYLNYYEKNKNLSYTEIVTRINSNLDNTFYDDSNESDLSKNMYTLVNKFYYLDSNYVPDNLETVSYDYAIQNTQLNKIALENFIKMSDAAKLENLTFKITTGYRSYSFQNSLYNAYANKDGVKLADTYSARPGYSEHQLGYSADLTSTNYSEFDDFEYTEEYEWLKENAHKYGFILRYPKDKEYITGYQFESWHYRYVGIDVATYIYENNITYEEYYAYFLR